MRVVAIGVLLLLIQCGGVLDAALPSAANAPRSAMLGCESWAESGTPNPRCASCSSLPLSDWPAGLGGLGGETKLVGPHRQVQRFRGGGGLMRLRGGTNDEGEEDEKSSFWSSSLDEVHPCLSRVERLFES